MQLSMMHLSNLITRSVRLDATRNQALDNVFEGFSLNQSMVNTIQQLIQLMADIQRHRACSLAILSGDLSYEAMTISLEKKIGARLTYLDNQAHMTEVIDQHEWDKVLTEWKVVGYRWRQDNVQHNFELHSHLIEKILNIVRDAGRWVLGSGNYSESTANNYLSHAVFDYIFTQHLYQIETLGKLRGLTTCLTGMGEDSGIRMRIGFLLECARQDQLQTQSLLHSQAGLTRRYAPALVDIEETALLFEQWLALMANLLDGKTGVSEATAHEVFQLATSVIDAKLALTEQALAYLQLTMADILEHLLEEASMDCRQSD